MKTLPRHGDGVGLQIFYIFSPPCIQPGGAGAGAVDDVLITRGAVTSELRSSHVSDDNLRRPRGHYLWPCLCRKALFVTTFLHFFCTLILVFELRISDHFYPNSKKYCPLLSKHRPTWPTCLLSSSGSVILVNRSSSVQWCSPQPRAPYS